jgi:dTDP-glucose 4,6-dehydratase
MARLLVTGGLGFIGSNFIRYWMKKHAADEVINLDKITYAGNPDNLKDLEASPRYTFIKGDIADRQAVEESLAGGADYILNFAAETHVDRSIGSPGAFIRTDVCGTYELLEGARRNQVGRYLQVSTDEVYGSLAAGSAKESDPLEPNSPYAAGKAAGDHLVRAYHVTYGLNTVTTRGSNNFGPYQYPEKIIPLFVTHLLEGRKVPLYGDGQNVRDWIYVLDHCRGIETVLLQGEPGEVYNIGGGNEIANRDLTERLLRALGRDESCIEYVQDRPGHDRRYSLDTSKIRRLGWKPEYTFDEALESTIGWYREHESWWKKIKTGEYWEYYKAQYGRR